MVKVIFLVVLCLSAGGGKKNIDLYRVKKDSIRDFRVLFEMVDSVVQIGWKVITWSVDIFGTTNIIMHNKFVLKNFKFFINLVTSYVNCYTNTPRLIPWAKTIW